MIHVPAFLCNQVNRGNEPVPPAGDGLHETRCLWVVAKYITDLADGGIEAVLGVDKGELLVAAVVAFTSISTSQLAKRSSGSWILIMEEEKSWRRETSQFYICTIGRVLS